MSITALQILSSVPSEHPCYLVCQVLLEECSRNGNDTLESNFERQSSIVVADELWRIFMAKHEVAKDNPKVISHGFPESIKNIQNHGGTLLVFPYTTQKKSTLFLLIERALSSLVAFARS